MIANLEEMKQDTQRYCPDEISLFDNVALLSFMERLEMEFPKLGLEKRFTAKGLFHGLDFCYLRPIVFWTQTGIPFCKRYEDELRADFFVKDGQFGFEAFAPYNEDDDMDDETTIQNHERTKTWPLMALDYPDKLLHEVLAEFKAFYRKYRASKSW